MPHVYCFVPVHFILYIFQIHRRCCRRLSILVNMLVSYQLAIQINSENRILCKRDKYYLYFCSFCTYMCGPIKICVNKWKLSYMMMEKKDRELKSSPGRRTHRHHTILYKHEIIITLFYLFIWVFLACVCFTYHHVWGWWL